MTKNMATGDRLIRSIIVAPLAVIAAFVLGTSTVAGIVLLVFAAVMWLTSLVSFCPLYAIFGLHFGETKRTA